MQIRINGEYFHAVLPCQQTDTHEGGLNTATVDIRHLDRKSPFEPYSPVVFDDDTWVVDSDKVTYEPMIQRYTHSVTLCEEAKVLEKIICGAKSFSKPKSGEYVNAETALATKKVIKYKDTTNGSIPEEVKSEVEYPQSYWSIINHIYTTPSIGKEFTVRSYKTVVPGASYTGNYDHEIYYLAAKDGKTISEGTITQNDKEEIITGLSDGSIITIKYTEIFSEVFSGDSELQTRTDTEYTFTIDVKESNNELVRKPLTVFEVANRLLYTYEAHTLAEEPLFRMNGANGEWIGGDMVLGAGDDMECPELSFANGATLKENLDRLGAILHAKVRVKNYTVYFERLTKPEQSYLPPLEIDGADSFTGEKYGGEVQTFAQNVVNYNDGAGTVTNLFAKTLRTEEGNVRIGDDGGFISTEFPIEKIVKVEYVHKTTNADGKETFEKKEITEMVVENTYYNTLSSYAGTLSKANHIYYTQGQKNIKGLFFKATSIVSGTGIPVLDNYAISNILGEYGHTVSENGYKDLLFEVTYIAVCNLRASTPRPDGKGGRTSFVMNQSENRTDATQLGRKMYATAVQLTSNSPQKTYIVPPGGELPVVGKQYDRDNYISQMAVEYFPTYTKATINISENYNRLSDYVAISQAIRQYEIDVNNVQERHILYKDWCLLGFAEPSREDIKTNQCSLNPSQRFRLVVLPFASVSTEDDRVKAAVSITWSSADISNGVCQLDSAAGAIKSCIFPAIAVGLGNSLLFAYRYEDNYSAGSRAVYSSDSTLAQYNEQKYVTYADNYGNAELLSFGFATDGSTNEPIFTGRALPENISDIDVMDHLAVWSGGFSSDSTDKFSRMRKKVHLYKDSRETIILEYQLLFGSDEGIIIGADYCETNPMVRKNSKEETSELCFYNHFIDPIQGSTEIPESDARKCTVTYGSNYLSPETGFTVPDHKAWAIVRGGKFLLGQNAAWETEETNGIKQPKKLYFDFCHRR